jgi:DNA repair exonuclease SbcCD ATPase subunit
MVFRIIASAAALSFFLSGCQSFKEEFEQVSRERDSLIYASDLKDSSINALLADFNAIEKNLDSIAQRQEALDITSLQHTEAKATQRDRINENIRIINDLLELNRKLIADLQAKLRASQGRVAELNILVDRLQVSVAEKEKELGITKARLNELDLNLENLNVMLDTITAQKQATDKALQDKIRQLNTAYYVVGTFKELRQKNVVDKEGGFLGIGKNQLLKQDFNNDAFTRIDITETKLIDFGGKEGRIITNHPSGSYSLVRSAGKLSSLNISDPEKFWGASKYLVVITQ